MFVRDNARVHLHGNQWTMRKTGNWCFFVAVPQKSQDYGQRRQEESPAEQDQSQSWQQYCDC
jgi:hypothetical protein